VPHRDLVELSARFSQAFLRWLDESPGGGLTYPRLRILESLHCQGPEKMRSLADAIGLSARNMTALADSLEADGLVRRTPHPTDRRITLLELTDEGMAAAGESLTPRLVAVSSVFDDLSPTERERLRAALEKLVDVMAHTECTGV
jgi:DNA-binding MarR family transcriptional regulator